MATDTAKLQILLQLRDQTQAGFRTLENNLGSVASGLSTAAANAAKLGAAMAATGALFGIKAASDFETMRVALTTALDGSKEAADEAFKTISDFATKTPFQMEEVMNSFVKLKNMGLDPSERALTSYGDTASAMGKSLDQMVEAVADAATGEFERLKEFGIRASQEGDRVTFTFKGMSTTVGKNADEIQEYLLALGEQNFAGGMAAQSQTLAGRFSTLKDSIKIAAANIVTDVGLMSATGEGMLALTEAVNNLSNNFTSFYNKAKENFSIFIETTRPLWDFLIERITTLWENIRYQLIPALIDFWNPTGKAIATFLSVVLYGAFVLVVEIINVLVTILAVLLDGTDKVMTFFQNVAVGAITMLGDAFTWLSEKIEGAISWLKNAYDWAVKAFNKMRDVVGLGGGKSTKVDDAVISPSGDIVTTNPKDWLIATQNPAELTGGGGTTINIGKLYGTDRNVAERFASEIARQVKLQTRVS